MTDMRRQTFRRAMPAQKLNGTFARISASAQPVTMAARNTPVSIVVRDARMRTRAMIATMAQ